ncbi:snoaL-like domain protein [Sinorhizobium sp. KGO-5]|uniref:nuclear transport factor 2 family protein n=1 Tax=Sinorhizobium TaxID=28105 RepID=UPI0018657694|nr:nuclear transport factor 2 family protein [Sinorhizobium meliloti]MDW9364355.1 nuclear transport factor 2 family protein [Sinorhizobium meliloti]GCA52764.1 snoaL-like domain protein [Sinorhizobium sp. KGO-5]
MLKTTTLQLWVLALAAVLCGSAAAEGDSSAVAVLDHPLHAFAAGDADAILADYTEDSVLITPQAILKGPAAIRPLFEAMIKEFSSPNAGSTIHERHAFGPIAYIIWSAETPQNSYRFATDTIYVVDGRVLYPTFAADVVAK